MRMRVVDYLRLLALYALVSGQGQQLPAVMPRPPSIVVVSRGSSFPFTKYMWRVPK